MPSVASENRFASVLKTTSPCPTGTTRNVVPRRTSPSTTAAATRTRRSESTPPTVWPVASCTRGTRRDNCIQTVIAATASITTRTPAATTTSANSADASVPGNRRAAAAHAAILARPHAHRAACVVVVEKSSSTLPRLPALGALTGALERELHRRQRLGLGG